MTTTSKNIELIVKQWTTFDLKTIQHDLDVTTTEIASRADESDQSRKKLVELSREFKKNTNEDVRKAIAPILKSFQVEIDSLSKRSKAAEKAFLEIYRHLSELPDPVPALEYAQSLQRRAEKVSDLEVENQKLRETLDEYNHEFADVKNQEVTIKQLREKIKDLEDKTESTIQQRIKEKEKELQRNFAEKERQLQNQQFDLVTKYAEMEMRQAQLQSALEHAHQEMFEYKSKQEDATSARSSELDILNQDLERANERASNAERLVDRLREQLDQTQKFMASVSSSNNSDDATSPEELERKLREKLEFELAAKEREIAALVVDTQKLQSTLMKVKETSVSQISDLENVLNAKEKIIAQLESKLNSQADYDEIKRELTILKSIEFPTSTSLSYDQSGNASKKSLEVLLLEKNRALQNEQTQLKVANSELESNTSHHKTHHYSSLDSYRTDIVSPLSPSSPVQIPLKSSSHLNEEIPKSLNNSSAKIVSLLPSNDNLQSTCNSLSAPVDTKYSPCPTMITPTTLLTSSSTSSTSPELHLGQHLNSVRWTKLSCPPASSSSSSSSSTSPSNLTIASTDVKTIAPLPTNGNSLEPLDTACVANIVRKILAQHNIGQRVFARHILSLSQGTVSELLSKPKPWSKLTEKGKESYRKMWSWANSEENILALKSLSPRKGVKDNQSSLTQHKVLQILSDEHPKAPRTPSTSSTSSRTDSLSESQQRSLISPTMLSTFVPSLLMQTTNRLKSDMYSPYNILCPQPENYRNWLMLQEIVRTNAMIKQLKPNNVIESEQENEDDIDDNPLDLSMKVDNEQTSSNKPPTVKSNNKTSIIPLTEQDLSKYHYINTAELVQTVKDILSRFSISQRHFGEKVLGLSQGSVSDILARPKSWESLTQKGREPFIRMRLFLDDPNAIKQLVQTVSVSLSPTTLNDLQTRNLISNENSVDSQSNDYSHGLVNENMPSSSLLHDTTMTNNNNNNNNNNKSRSRTKTQNSLRLQSSTKSKAPPYDLQIVPIPTHVDTEQLSSQVRELLSLNSIGQRVFGEAVLNLSQGTVSEILSKPRPWHALSVKGREPYIRMYSWYHDAGNVQKLLAWKQKRDVLRRTGHLSATTTDSNDVEARYNDNALNDRFPFTDDQHHTLQNIFKNEPYPSQTRLEQLADELSLPTNKILNWFHHARMKTKTTLRSMDIEKLATSPLNDDDTDNPLPTIEPLNSAWFNDAVDSDSTSSPKSVSASSTTIIPCVADDKKSIGSISSSKKRKSIPQKIIRTKRPVSNSASMENDHYDESNISNTTTNESTSLVNINN